MPSDESDYSGKPTENRISKNAAQPLAYPLPGGPRQKPGSHFTREESLR
jgi:hypothetical protein